MARDRDDKSEGRIVAGELAVDGTSVSGALAEAQRFAEANALAERDGDRLRLVVEELVTNAVLHGRPPASSKIAYRFALGSEGIEIRLDDPGAPFDPRNVPPAVAGRKKEGGFGWPIILTWCRIQDYQREDRRNRLVLVMPLTEEL